jgi:hypothetical protein
MSATEGLEDFLRLFGNAVSIVKSGQGSSATMHVAMDGVDYKIRIEKDTEEYAGDITVENGNPFAGEVK